MNKYWKILGNATFWVTWPGIWLMMRGSSRSRVVVVRDNKILLVKSWLGTGKWSLPGGGIHRGENSKTGAVRELFEETGIKVSENQLSKLPEGIARLNGLDFKYEAFWLELNENPPTKMSQLEIIDITWLPLSEISDKTVTADTVLIFDLWLHSQ